MSRIAIYPGSFDPVTFGHLDIITRAGKIFDQIIVAVLANTQKETLFSSQERLGLLRETTKGMPNVKLEAFDGLIVDFAEKHKVNVLVRGLRMISDFEYELQMALTNRRLDEKVETVFLMPSEGYSYLSSTLIKEAAFLGADITSFVPEIVAQQCHKKLAEQKKKKL